MLAVSRYAFKVSALASRGITHSSDFRSSQVDEDWKWLPWKFFGVLVVFGIFVGFMATRSLTLGVIANLLVAFLIPALALWVRTGPSYGAALLLLGALIFLLAGFACIAG